MSSYPQIFQGKVHDQTCTLLPSNFLGKDDKAPSHQLAGILNQKYPLLYLYTSKKLGLSPSSSYMLLDYFFKL